MRAAQVGRTIRSVFLLLGLACWLTTARPEPATSAQPASAAASSSSAEARRITPISPAPALDLRLPRGEADVAAPQTAWAIRVVLGLTLLALVPSLLVCLTAFLRIVIVLSMLRQAIGLPDTPPNSVLIGLALFLTLFTMNPVLQQLNVGALQPFMTGEIGTQEAVARAARPLRTFMIRQTREQDLALMVELSHAQTPDGIDDVGTLQLIPAFMLSELRAAFQIGFVIFLPFLLIDLVVSSILMSLGMMMMPPITVALPIKILMFVLVDGWSVVLKALVGSFR